VVLDWLPTALLAAVTVGLLARTHWSTGRVASERSAEMRPGIVAGRR